MKQRLRQHVRELLAGLSPDQQHRLSAAAGERLVQLPAFGEARNVMLYLPIQGEVDTTTIARAAWQQGKTVFCPTACENCRTMRPIRCGPEHESIFLPTLGLRQPDRHLGEAPPESVDLVIVPGLAFDRLGHRLGRGGGFYDRFLAQPGLRASRVGLAYHLQLLPDIPVTDTDQPVDAVVTDAESIPCPRRAPAPESSS